MSMTKDEREAIRARLEALPNISTKSLMAYLAHAGWAWNGGAWESERSNLPGHPIPRGTDDAALIQLSADSRALDAELTRVEAERDALTKERDDFFEGIG